MKKRLHKKFNWFSCWDNGWFRVKEIHSIEMDETFGGGWVRLTTKCDVCGKEETHSQTRAINDVPKVKDIIWPAYLTRRYLKI